MKKFGMNKPHLFKMGTEIQKLSNLKIVQENAHRIQWKKNGDTAIDVGCADGSLTAFIKKFKPFEEHYYKKFVGVDINENMIDYAKKNYENENISFGLLNLEGDVPEDLKRGFNHVFSFRTLQLVKDQEKGLKNIYDLIAEDGDTLITIMGQNNVYSAYQILGQNPKWKNNLLKNLKPFISPYHDMKNPEKPLNDIMKKCCFKDIDIQQKTITLDYTNEGLKDLVQSVEVFNTPQEVFDELMINFFSAVEENDLFKIKKNNNEITYELKYTLLVIFAKK